MDKERRRRRMAKVVKRLSRSATNAQQILREGRLGAPYFAPFDTIAESEHYRLRRYDGPREEETPVIILVPPLMVSSEVYDISPELSAVSTLAARGLDVWLVDYGAPEQEEGGMARTLDDHVLSLDQAISAAVATTGKDVHIAGYSQGGMFCYQAAAYRRSKGVASIIAFGSPVDIRRNLPGNPHEDVAEAFLKVARKGIDKPLEKLDGLPGWLTSRGFKLMSPKKEVEQIVRTFGMLDDTDGLLAREPRRLFLGGDGFVAWPGPALKTFIDDFIVQNRMASGGFVIDGRTVSLTDINVPILYFCGTRDDIARPPSVRAIEKIATESPNIVGVDVAAGHFGLVVGSKAMSRVWPDVAQWVLTGEVIAAEEPARKPITDDATPGANMLYDLATDVVDQLWHRMGDASMNVTRVAESLRWQLPRIARIESLGADDRVSIGAALADQADAIPEKTFFLWDGRAFSYAEADVRVNQILAALREAGLKPGHHAGVLMENHPNFLTTVAAINRLGCVAVLLNAGTKGKSLAQALEVADVDMVITDEHHAADAREVAEGVVAAFHQPDVEGIFDIEAHLDPANSGPPADITPNPGRASDLAILIFTSGTTGLPKAARVTNGRWAIAALGTAAACRLSPNDTVYCPLPLYHATGMLVAVGGALIGGSRLALERKFSATNFWDEVRRYGASVVFYVGEVCRYLVNAPTTKAELKHPVRLFVGNGMRPDVWHRLLDRFGPLEVIEFYGSTEGNVAIANLDGAKIGSIGRPLPGSAEIVVVAYDVEEDDFVRDVDGFLIPVSADEAGVLIGRIEPRPLATFDGYLDGAATERKVLRNVFETGDAWFNSGDLVSQDDDGDFWFVDRVGDTFRHKSENVSTDQVAEVVGEADFIDLVTVFGIDVEGVEGRVGTAAVVLSGDFDGDALYRVVSENLSDAAQPVYVRVVEDLEMTGSYKFLKFGLRQQGIDPASMEVYELDSANATYVRMT